MTTSKDKLLSQIYKKDRPLTTGEEWNDLGCYVSERQWGTVREDFSDNGDAWAFFSYEQAMDTVYQSGEDGIAALCDFRQIFVLSFAFWNGVDSLLKERLFGLSNPEGNHGEDVKELYYHELALPHHEYVKFVYKYPCTRFPYEELREKNRLCSTADSEYELTDTEVFKEGYFDIIIEYSKITPYDLLIQVSLTNRSDKERDLHVVPELFFRNRWQHHEKSEPTPNITQITEGVLYLDTSFCRPIETRHGIYVPKPMYLHSEMGKALFTDNETGKKGDIHRAIVEGKSLTAKSGTKSALHHQLTLKANEQKKLRFRFSEVLLDEPFANFAIYYQRGVDQAKRYFDSLIASCIPDPLQEIIKKAISGLIYSKQYYRFDMHEWLSKRGRSACRNQSFSHFLSYDIISMPDKWEYPWFAAWDLSFQALALATVDIESAKKMLWFLLLDRTMHPNGQLPAYEWEFASVNPPIQAFAVLRVFRYEEKIPGKRDIDYLKKCFERLSQNFTWWVNRKDGTGRNVFEGGFCGFDNISVLNRDQPLMNGGRIEQSDSTAWMGLFALSMMRIALEIAKNDPSYQSMASKYLRHFVLIANSFAKNLNRTLNNWSQEDQFFYDVIMYPDGHEEQVKVRSMVGIVPTFAIEFISDEELQQFPEFAYLFQRFLKRRSILAKDVLFRLEDSENPGYLIQFVDAKKMGKVYEKIFDPDEFLSPFGVRSLSKIHEKNPYSLLGQELSYEPAESRGHQMGGNSNWRGPIWMPVNYLIADTLWRLDKIYKGKWKIPLKNGDGKSPKELADDLVDRLASLFLEKGERRPIYEGSLLLNRKDFREHLLFYEYFHGDTGKGLGASHQTGWTALIANLILHRYA